MVPWVMSSKCRPPAIQVLVVVIPSDVAGCSDVPRAINICFAARHFPSRGLRASWNSAGKPRCTKGGRVWDAVAGVSAV
jgi:hypothetical protein